MTRVEGIDTHVDALTVLAESGQPVTQESYAAAVGETNFKRLLRDVGGYGDAEFEVTESVLAASQLELLAEDGYAVGDRIPEPAQRQALAQAVRELGPVGTVRRDAEEVLLARRERLVDEAIASRKIPASERGYWVTAIANDGSLETALATMPANPTIDAFASVAVDGGTERVTLPDDTGLELHVRAEAWLEQNGRAERDPVTGELVYDADAYLVGAREARAEMVLGRTEADLRARGVKEADWLEVDGRETAAYAAARREAELRVDGRLS